MKKTFIMTLLAFIIAGCTKQLSTTATISQANFKNISTANFTGGADTLINLWTFDDATPFHGLTLEREADSDIAIATDPVDISNKVMRCRLSPTSYRTESSIIDASNHLLYFYANSTAGSPNSSSLGSEIWAGGRIFKPADTGLGTIKASLLQLGPVDTGNGSTGSGFSQLRLHPSTNKWNWRIYQSALTPLYYDGDLASFNYGQWQNFVVHCIYRDDSQGLIEVWIDGVKTLTLTGANAIVHDRIRFKWGIYIGAGNYPSTPVTCYFDDIKLGGPTSSYSQVAPQNSIVSATADTYVYGNSPNASYGSATLLNVKNGGSAQYDRIAFVKFDLSALGYTPASAKLILTSDATTAAGTISANQCFPSPRDWPDNNSFTWNSHPAVGTFINSVNVSAGSSQELVIDVSDYVKNQYLSNNRIITVALTGNNALMVLRSLNNTNGGVARLSLIK